MQPDVSDHLLLENLPQSLFYLLEEDLGDPTTQGVDGVQELGLDGVEERVEHVVLEGKLRGGNRRFSRDVAPEPGRIRNKTTHVTYGVVDHLKGRLLVVVVHAAVAVEDGHAVLLGAAAVAPVHAVIGPVVPLAREDEETLWRPNTRLSARIQISSL